MGSNGNHLLLHIPKPLILQRYCRTAKDGLLIADTIPEVSHPDVAQMSELITAMAKLKSTVNGVTAKTATAIQCIIDLEKRMSTLINLNE
ncbi:hypothetical protein LINPERPRIM_LOCUS23912, partial [Linum perenne]